MRVLRLFTAIQLDERTRDALCGLMREMRESGVSAGFTRRENLHLTLVFIGETERLQAAKQAMDAVRCAPLTFSVSGMGAFAHGGVLWAGVGRSAALENVHARLRAALSAAGFVLDERPYVPHLTLARRAQGTDPALWGQRLQKLVARADKISLMKSERVAGRLVYTEIHAKRLEEAPPGAAVT